jgi:hypothetical protein
VIVKSISTTIILPEEMVSNKKLISVKYAIYRFVAGNFLKKSAFVGKFLLKNAM